MFISEVWQGKARSFLHPQDTPCTHDSLWEAVHPEHLIVFGDGSKRVGSCGLGICAEGIPDHSELERIVRKTPTYLWLSLPTFGSSAVLR